MPASQLKRLKASLREQGIVGPQKSKKQKRQLAQNPAARDEKRLHRTVALENIREQFNPFDLKLNARGPKFDVTTSRPATGAAAKGIRGRPGASKSLAEERRRQTLLVEMQRKHKVGGLLDRRYGEENPDQELDEVMVERFAKEKQRSHKNSIFNLEDDEPSEGLTHMGRALDLNGPAIRDDYDEDDLDDVSDSDGSVNERKQLKRMRSLANLEDGADGEEDGGATGQPERKKTKKEIMEEVIAKSKMHKAERQAEKEAAEELREAIDNQLPEIQAMLFNDHRVAPTTSGKYDVAVIAGKDKDMFEKDFDRQVRELKDDQRARPADRTKTDEEKAQAQAEKMGKLEEARTKRMAGEAVSDDEGDDKEDDREEEEPPAGVFYPEVVEDDGFGLGQGIRTRPTATQLGFEDEDDFLIDDDLVASGSELEFDSGDEDGFGEEDLEGDEDSEGEDEEDDEFTAQFLNAEARAQALASEQAQAQTGPEGKDADGLPLTLPCPSTVDEFVALASNHPADKIPAIVQRIRAAYHPKLDGKNKEKLAKFATALVDYVSLPRDPSNPATPPFSVLESIIRHIHSLAKTFFSIEMAKQFRLRLAEIGRDRPLALHAGDLVMLTAVGSIFPTSDHFHQVVTPAMLVIGRFLGQKIPQALSDYATGAYLSILVIQYQRLAKRFVPELLTFCLNALLALAPVATTTRLGDFPVHESTGMMRVAKAQDIPVRKLSFADCQPDHDTDTEHALSTKVATISTIAQIIDAAAETWAGKPATIETLTPASSVLTHLLTKPSRTHLPPPLIKLLDRTTTKLSVLLQSARLARRPLELHHHRPLAIKMHLPKFEDGFDPTKHYDPDRDRADLARLRAEHKRERKGAMRELRRDAAFVVREKLRIKTARDEAYERKHARILAEIQTEAGQEANEYEREKKARQRANKRRRG